MLIKYDMPLMKFLLKQAGILSWSPQGAGVIGMSLYTQMLLRNESDKTNWSYVWVLVDLDLEAQHTHNTYTEVREKELTIYKIFF